MRSAIPTPVVIRIVVFAAVTWLPLFSRAQEDIRKPVVAVFEIRTEGFTLPSRTKALLNGYLSSRLTSTGKFTVSPSASIRKAMIELKIDSQQECYDDACRIELGRVAAAHKYVSGLVWKLGGSCTLTLDLYDLRSETMDSSIELTDVACSDAPIKEALGNAVELLARDYTNSTSIPLKQHILSSTNPKPVGPKQQNRFLGDLSNGKIRVEWFGMNMGGGYQKYGRSNGLLDFHAFTVNGRNWYYGILEGGFFLGIGHTGVGGRAGYQYIAKHDWVIRAGGKLGWTHSDEWKEDGYFHYHNIEIAPHLQFLKFLKHGSVGLGVDVLIWVPALIHKEYEPKGDPINIDGGVYFYFRWSAF